MLKETSCLISIPENNFSFVEGEETIIGGMRKWSKSFFVFNDTAENLLLSFSNDNEENLLCKVMKVYEDEEDSYWVRVKDNDGKWWKLKVDKIKYPELQKDEIIRIKSAKGTMHEGENVLEMKPHSNILKLMKDSRIERKLLAGIVDDDIDRVIRDNEEPINELQITKNFENFDNYEESTILKIHFPNEYKNTIEKENMKINKEEIKSEYSSDVCSSKQNKNNEYDKSMSDEDRRYLLKFNVVWYEPNDIKEFVKGYCNSWNES